MKLHRKNIIMIILLLTISATSYAAGESFDYYKSTMPNPQAKILLLYRVGLGERETIERIKIAAARLNIETKFIGGVVIENITWPNEQNIPNNKDIITKAINTFQPDFLLTIEEFVPYYSGYPNYMTLTISLNRFLSLDKNHQLKLLNPEHAKFDAILPSFKEIDKLQIAYEKSGKKFLGFPWYPTAYITDYTPAIAQYLFYSGGELWDSTRSSQKYQEIFKMLDKTGYFAVCGIPNIWMDYTPNSLVGLIKFDGSSLISVIHKAGASLILHHKEHLESGAPTARIFEAAAANVIIISDKHPFIQKHFGNNVLYIDIEQDATSIFKQIDTHMKWILTHQKQAQQMADNCNKIFKEKFSLEQQLGKLISMHKDLPRR
jgi:hypothetical protein